MYICMEADWESGGTSNMPIYEFRCSECDEVSEEMLSIKSTVKTIKCPICESKSEKILSLGSFHLKGGGWYKDGYGKRSASKEEVAKVNTKSSGGITKAKPILDN